MSTIVVPTDFSDLAGCALPLACRMAEALGADIHCLHVLRDRPYYEGIDVVLAESMPTMNELRRTAEERLSAYIAAELPDYTGRIVPVVAIGTPYVQIIRYARET